MTSQLSYYIAEAEATFHDWSVGDLLAAAVRATPQRVALISAPHPGEIERQWTYEELHAQAQRTASSLLARFRPGDRVATWAGNSAEIIFLQLGAALAHVILVTVNPANRAQEIHYQLEQSQARGLFLERQYRGLDNQAVIENLRARLPALAHVFYLDEWTRFVNVGSASALPDVPGSAPAMIMYTSGTTGKPKGVVERHRGLVNNARLTNERMQIRPGSTWLTTVPLFHIGGNTTMVLGCIANHGTNVLLREFNPEVALESIERYRVSFTFMVPTMFYAMLHSERLDTVSLSSMELVMTGATTIPPDLVRQLKRRFHVDVIAAFGQTEAGGCMYVTHRHDGEERITGSVGVALPLSESKIVSIRTGEVLPRGEVGEICTRTRCCMIEYFQMPDKSAQAIDQGGWLHTGDLGIMRADGYVQVTGRLKDMIIRGGENIYPREIEDVLAEHEAIAQAAVFGIPDAKWGEQVAAAVILRQGKSAEECVLIEYLQARIARHKVPKFWFFVDGLPTNASGKIQKFALREAYANAGGQSV